MNKKEGKKRRTSVTDCGDSAKLINALNMLSALERRHQELLSDFEALSEKYIYTKHCAIGILLFSFLLNFTSILKN